MSGGLVTAAYIVAAILFIFSLAGLSKHETSRQGNNFGIAGMAIALIATIFGPDTGNVGWILLAMVIGGAIGIRLAKKVEMTEMPEELACKQHRLTGTGDNLFQSDLCWNCSSATH